MLEEKVASAVSIELVSWLKKIRVIRDRDAGSTMGISAKEFLKGNSANWV